MIKILVITQNCGPDYLSDLVFEGLANNRKVKLYANHIPPYLIDTFTDLKNIYGRGFTAFGNISQSSANEIIVLTERDIYSYCARNAFDYIIYTSIQRSSLLAERILDLKGTTPIFFLDGEDNTDILSKYASQSFYFKREITDNFYLSQFTGLRSISFKVSHNKIFNGKVEKRRLLAPCDPRDRRTYIYETESSYYQQYRESYFGVTMKKGGWDCMRHYEIIMNRCLPIFIGVENMPLYTIREYPKELQLKCNNLYLRMSKEGPDRYLDIYYSYLEQFHSWLKECMTTNTYLPFLLRNTIC